MLWLPIVIGILILIFVIVLILVSTTEAVVSAVVQEEPVDPKVKKLILPVVDIKVAEENYNSSVENTIAAAQDLGLDEEEADELISELGLARTASEYSPSSSTKRCIVDPDPITKQCPKGYEFDSKSGCCKMAAAEDKYQEQTPDLIRELVIGHVLGNAAERFLFRMKDTNTKIFMKNFAKDIAEEFIIEEVLEEGGERVLKEIAPEVLEKTTVRKMANTQYRLRPKAGGQAIDIGTGAQNIQGDLLGRGNTKTTFIDESVSILIKKMGKSAGARFFRASMKKILGKAVARFVTFVMKQVAKLVAKIALYTTMGPLGAILAVLDMASMIIDFMDPTGYNLFTSNSIITKIRDTAEFQQAFAYMENDLDPGRALISPETIYPEFSKGLGTVATETMQNAYYKLYDQRDAAITNAIESVQSEKAAARKEFAEYLETAETIDVAREESIEKRWQEAHYKYLLLQDFNLNYLEVKEEDRTRNVNQEYEELFRLYPDIKRSVNDYEALFSSTTVAARNLSLLQRTAEHEYIKNQLKLDKYSYLPKYNLKIYEFPGESISTMLSLASKEDVDKWNEANKELAFLYYRDNEKYLETIRSTEKDTEVPEDTEESLEDSELADLVPPSIVFWTNKVGIPDPSIPLEEQNPERPKMIDKNLGRYLPITNAQYGQLWQSCVDKMEPVRLPREAVDEVREKEGAVIASVVDLMTDMQFIGSASITPGKYGVDIDHNIRACKFTQDYCNHVGLKYTATGGYAGLSDCKLWPGQYWAEVIFPQFVVRGLIRFAVDPEGELERQFYANFVTPYESWDNFVDSWEKKAEMAIKTGDLIESGYKSIEKRVTNFVNRFEKNPAEAMLMEADDINEVLTDMSNLINPWYHLNRHACGRIKDKKGSLACSIGTDIMAAGLSAYMYPGSVVSRIKDLYNAGVLDPDRLKAPTRAVSRFTRRAAATVANEFNEFVDDTEEFAQDFGQGAQQMAETAYEDLSTGIQTLGDNWVSIRDSSGEAIVEGAETVGEGVETIIIDSVDYAEDFGEDVGDFAEDVTEDVAEGTQQVAETVYKGLKTGAYKTGDFLAGVADDAESFFQNLGEEFSDFFVEDVGGLFGINSPESSQGPFFFFINSNGDLTSNGIKDGNIVNNKKDIDIGTTRIYTKTADATKKGEKLYANIYDKNNIKTIKYIVDSEFDDVLNKRFFYVADYNNGTYKIEFKH